MGDTSDAGTPTIVVIFIVIAQEISLYVNSKDRADLFIEKEVNMKQ